MASIGGGKVYCPKCGATSTKSPFGDEPNRVSRPREKGNSMDPVLVKRRARAARIRAQNKRG